VQLTIPAGLRDSCQSTPTAASWLDELPEVVDTLARRWSLAVGPRFDSEHAGCAWVAPATRAHGQRAVLELAMPHFEGEREIDGLRFWSGDPTVRLLDADHGLGAMLLERCEPGTALRSLPKAFIGDPAYGATQHLLNCRARLFSDPNGMIRRVSDLLEVSDERVRLWTFARVAVESGGEWAQDDAMALARALAP
jgi:streptomycin 6-kinase